VPPDGRFLVAFDDGTLTWDPVWTALDQEHPSLVTSYTIDRGRQFELDRTDTGRATVEIADRDGLLDPTNPAGPYYGKIEPLLPAMIGRRNPVDGNWYTRFRGFVEELDYGFDPSQQVNRLAVSLVDLFEIVAAIEMQDDMFSFPGSSRPASTDGQVYLAEQKMDDRVNWLLSQAGIPDEFSIVFTGNVRVWQTVYSPAESVMTAIAEAVDAEWPGVSNVFCDRHGRICVHGRLAKFDPAGTAAGATPGAWDFNSWDVGDGDAVTAAPTTTAQLREFAFNRGLAKIINSGFATPTRAMSQTQLTADELNGQTVTDAASIAQYGVRSWSAQDLLTKVGLLDDSDDLVETKRFAQYYVDNYKQPRNRVTVLGLRTIHPSHTAAAETWQLLSKVDIADAVNVSIVGSPGMGGFALDPYFVEGVHEEVRPLNPDYDDITLRLDLSPQAYFDTDPWA
jgi:hypothetical protein